jgi:glycerate 2-kinase
MSTGAPISRRYCEGQEHVELLVRAALDAAEPAAAVTRHWPDELRGVPCDVLAVGKAAGTMLAGVMRSRLCTVRSAMALGVPGTADALRGIDAEVHEADHPLPTERNVIAARRVTEFVTHTKQTRGTLVVLLSGGASALLSLPVDGVTLEDLRRVTEALLRGGAPIESLNCVRKHLEVLKGGGLARHAAPSPVWTLVLSDVIGDDLSSIGSGPTCADPTTFADALGVMKRYRAEGASPVVTRVLEEGAAGQRPETVKPGDGVLTAVQHRIVGNNDMAVDAVVERARSLGYEPIRVIRSVRGEARDFGWEVAKAALEAARTLTGPACIVAGGETTVTVICNGRGGRNQEISLAAAMSIADHEGVVVASFGTDGMDGRSDAAGAVATGESVKVAAKRGVDARRSLDENDSFSFFEASRGLIRTGPTGTNVNDVTVALIRPQEG